MSRTLLVALVLMLGGVAAFTTPAPLRATRTVVHMETPSLPKGELTRRESGLAFFAAAAATVALPGQASARGRATQIKSWERYGSRVEGMRSWLAGSLPALIKTGNAAAIRDATEKKGQGLSYLAAMDLWAATFTDASPSPKTNAMLAKSDELRTILKDMNALAYRAMGENLKSSGGFLGVGASKEKALSPDEFKSAMNAKLADAKVAYSAYVDVNNVGLPFEIDKIMEF